ncbi:MAG: HDIG domain-containing protein [Bacteroidaceae bacterium]|nr:HDIG domain-containing protein [Bacteroidaceae bacterium]
MSRYNHPHEYDWKVYLIHFLVIALMSTVIVWFLPREGNSQLYFEIGKPWPYNKLLAPFEFPIYKSDVQIKHERDSVMQTYQPYFEMQTSLSADQVRNFATTWNRDIHGLSHTGRIVRDFMVRSLQEVYQNGVVSNADLAMLNSDSIESIRIYHGVTSLQRRKVIQLMTQRDAYLYIRQGYEHLIDSLGLTQVMLPDINLEQYIIPNIIYDEKKSDDAREALEDAIATSSGMVYAGTSIIDRGDVVTEETYQKIISYQQALRSRNKAGKEDDMVMLGQILYVVIVLVCFAIYFNLFRNDYLISLRSMTLVVIITLAFPLITSFIVRNHYLSVYIIPYAMLPIIVRIFMDSRTAYISHTVSILLSAVALQYRFEFISTQLMAGLIAIYSLRELSERSQMIRSAIVVTISSMLFYLSLELMQGHTLLGHESMQSIEFSFFNHLLISGVFLLFAYPLLFILERMFGFTSNVTLVELSNINNSLLRNLSEVAPGTFQHSMQVSNLASEVARKIGANSQLVRTGALYHDIGKSYNPPFFTENQSGYNPHSQLDYEDSAKVIIRHVTEGLQMADKAKLPKVIRDFICTHHGRGLVKYFYISYRNKFPDKPVDEAAFTYPGPNPQTLEQAILMMADAVEASSRSLNEYNEGNISELVERIIDGQVNEGFFKECPITFRDIMTAKEVLKEKLMSIYHTRISYPTLNK